MEIVAFSVLLTFVFVGCVLLYFRLTEGNPDAVWPACRWGMHDPDEDGVCVLCGHESEIEVITDDDDEDIFTD